MTRNGAQDKPRASTATEPTPRQDRGYISEADLRICYFPRYALQDWRLDRPTIRVLMALSCFTDGATGEVRPAQETIAAIAGVRRPRVNEIIQDLVELGYLVKYQRSRCWTYVVMNPEIPPYGSVPPGGTKTRDRKAKKNLPRGGQDHVPPGGTPPVPTGGTQTPLTSLNAREASPDGEAKRSPDERGADAPLTGEADQNAAPGGASGPSALPSGKAGRKFSMTKSPFPSTRTPYNPLSEAAKHMSRQDVGRLIAMASEVGNKAALEAFGFDYRGKPSPPQQNLDQIDLEEAIDRARQAQPKP